MNDFHHLDLENPYSEIGSISYSPPTVPASPAPVNIGSIQQPIQQNLFYGTSSTSQLHCNGLKFNNAIIQPPVYDGSSDPSLWLQEYELTADANYWNDELKVKRLIGSLSGAPRLYFLSAIEFNPNLTWAEFKFGLKLRFTNTNENESSIASIYGRKQRHNETFNDYWFSKLQLIETKRPNLPIDDKKHLLIEGLLPSLRDKVMEQLIVRPTGHLEEVRNIAKQLSDLTTPGYYSKQNTSQRQGKVDGYAYMAYSNYNPNYPRRNRHTQTSGGIIDTSNTNPNNWRENIVCLACHGAGHYARSCPTRRQSTN
jgi:hypothetical protein